MPKKVLIALPPAMLAQVDFVAGIEHRTRSDLIREALRRYLLEFQRGGNVLQTPAAVEPKVINENSQPLSEKFPHLMSATT